MTRYVFLFAGSKGFSNYRHQADVMTLTNMFYHTSNVTTFLYGDINELYHTTDHRFDEYNESRINFTGDDVTVSKLNETMQSINYMKDDTIFLYYSDHGAPGMLLAPIPPEIYAQDLESILKPLSKKVKGILVIIEACYSGSIARYVSIPNVLILTASSSAQPSYSMSWDPKMKTFLTNFFTAQFIDYVSSNTSKRVLDMVNSVSNMTEQSSVNCFGDFNIAKMKLSKFIGKNINRRKSDKIDQLVSNKNSYDIYMKHHSDSLQEFVDLLKRQRIERILSKIPSGNCSKETIAEYRRCFGEIGEIEIEYLLPQLNYKCARRLC